MSKKWNKPYDRIISCWEGELAIFGGHYTKKECFKIIKEENYDDLQDYKDCDVSHVYAKWGVGYSPYGEKTSGFFIKKDYKKGRVKVTLLE